MPDQILIRRIRARRLSRRLAAVLVSAAAAPSLHAQINSTWNTVIGTWNVASNWTPVDVPDLPNNHNVFIGPVAPNAQVTFVPEDGTSDTVSNLTLSNNADLFTNGFQLAVTGQTTIDGAGTTIRVDPHATPGTAAFQTLTIDMNNGGALVMNGGIAAATSSMEVNAGSVLQGFGLINLGNADGVIEQAFENSGLIQVVGTTTAPQTLTLHANGVDTIDLDGDSELGVVDVSNAVANVNLDTTTLVIDGPLADGFGSTLPGAQLQIGQRDTITFNQNFEIDAGAIITMEGGNNVATLNGPGAITDIAGAAFTITGAAVISNNMAFTGTANTITLAASSTLTLNGTVTVPDASAFIFGTSSNFVVGGSTTISEAAGDFDWDGPSGVVTTTIQGSGILTLAVDQVDAGNDVFNGTLNLNDNGDLSVSVTGTEWQMAGTLNKNNAGTSNITGDRLVVTSAGNVVVTAGTLDTPAITLQSGSDVTVNGTLILGGGADLAGPATLTGTGTLRMEASSTVSANTTVNVNTFDWDGNAIGGTHTINDAVVFTINSTVFDADGDMDDTVSLGGNAAQLIVNGPTQWTMNGVLNANTALAGTATIGGTSRMVLASTMNVNGNTTISAPLTLGAGAFADIDSGFTLIATSAVTYAGGTIDGIGTYLPGPGNTVTADSTINPDTFDFDGGNWVVESGAQLTFNVIDYDAVVATNAFDATITLNNGAVLANSADPEFVMDNVLNMNATGGNGAEWSGDPIDIGNDAGTLDADINVTGDGNPNSQGRFFSQVDFNSDADVNVAAGASLVFNAAVNFDTVNGANNAEFTGAGILSFNNLVNVNEAVTLNMVGGTVDLDGNDATGEVINIDAPLTINAATMSSFGRVNGGERNTLDINNSAGTGVLTVNLDSASSKWTLNAAGVMNLVNDNAEVTLLAGSAVSLNGTVNVTGDVRTTARVDIGGTVNINTAGEPFRLAGGDLSTNPNTLAGGTISGPGILGADTGKALHGFGTINTPIDFDGTASLMADNGTMTVTNAIVDVGVIGTADADGILNIPAAWNANVAAVVELKGGTLQGGTVTNDGGGIQGAGTITSRVINNTGIGAVSNLGSLVVQTAANDNDWDGTTGTGQLQSTVFTLELRDNATFPFTGKVSASGFGGVYANGFALDFNPGSTITLTGGGKYQSTSSTDIGGAVVVNAGAGPVSTIQVSNNFFLTFEPTSTTTLNADLRLVNNNINVKALATFSGAGALIVPDGSHFVADNTANINVLLNMQGAFRPGNFEGIGRVTLADYQQASATNPLTPGTYDNGGELYVELIGTSFNQYDRLVVTGTAQIGGYLNIDIDEVSPGVPFVPALGNIFNIISAPGGVIGTFNSVDITGMPVGLTFHVNYTPTLVQLQVVNKPLFTADFDDDGDVDMTDLAIWKGAYNLNQLGDADGDNDSDAADWTIWRQQFGSAPGPLPSSLAVVPNQVPRV